MCRHHPKGGRIKLYMRRTKAADQKFDVETKKFGWSTTGHTRPVLLKEYKKWLDKGHFKLIDPRQQEEHNTFVHNEDGRPEALEGAKDDGVMCNAFVVQGYSQQPAPDGLLDEDEYPYRPQELLQLAAKHRTTPDKVLERFRHRAPKRPLDLVSDDHVTIWDLQIPT